jgi:peptidoglycan/xylan/chitin deacetylase (PgdA/CDA1 family)
LKVIAVERLAGAGLASGLCLAGAGLMAYAVRGRSSRIFGPSVWLGDERRKSVAITFDDGPSESTPEFLDVLREYGAPATFFQCGANLSRLPDISRAVYAAGHEIGSHSYSHPLCCFRSEQFIEGDFARAQDAFGETLGVKPSLLRAPFGARWFGYRTMQERLGLLGVMWTVIGRDWKLPAAAICDRVLGAVRNGAIICLHDGRTLSEKPDVRDSLEALKRILPALIERGYRFETVKQLVCPEKTRLSR